MVTNHNHICLDEKTTRNFLAAMRNICGFPQFREKMVKLGAAKALVGVNESCHKTQDIFAVVDCLEKLSVNILSHKTMVEEHALRAVVNLSKHDDEAIQISSALGLARFAANKAMYAKCLEAGVLDAGAFLLSRDNLHIENFTMLALNNLFKGRFSAGTDQALLMQIESLQLLPKILQVCGNFVPSKYLIMEGNEPPELEVAHGMDTRRSGVAVLAQMSCDPSLQHQLVHHNLVSVISKILSDPQHIADEDIVMNGLAVIANVTANILIRNSSKVAGMVAGFVEHEAPFVAKAAAVIFANLSCYTRERHNTELIALASLIQHREEEVVQYAILALSNVAMNPASHEAIAHAWFCCPLWDFNTSRWKTEDEHRPIGVSLPLSLLLKHMHSGHEKAPAVRENSLVLIAELASNHTMRQLLKEQGEVFVRPLMKLPSQQKEMGNEVDAQKAWVRCVANLALDSDLVFKKELIEWGCVKAIEALCYSCHDADARKFGGMALNNLSASMELRESLIAKGLPLVMRLLEGTTDLPTVRIAIQFVDRMCRIHFTLQGNVVEQGVVPAVVRLPRACPDPSTHEVELHTMRALAAVTCTIEQLPLCFKEGVLALVVSLAMHIHDPEVRKQCAICLQNLSYCAGKELEMVQGQVVAALGKIAEGSGELVTRRKAAAEVRKAEMQQHMELEEKVRKERQKNRRRPDSATTTTATVTATATATATAIFGSSEGAPLCIYHQ